MKSARGWESDGLTPRLQEQFGYAYDAAWNLAQRTNNALVQSFGVNNLNELTSATRSGTLTVAGTTTEDPPTVTGVTVSGTGLSSGPAQLYADGTWARTNATLANGANSYTAVAQDSYGRTDTSSVSVNLPAAGTFVYDLNGNLRTNNTRIYDYDDENQLIRVTEPGSWKSDFAYDGLLRRRVRYESTWNGSAWITNTTVRYLYDGNVVIQERDANNLPQVTYTRGRDMSGSLQGAGGIGGLLARTDNSLTLNSQLSTSAHAYYHADGNGNVTALVNTNGVVVAKYEYDPFGNILAMSGPMANANLYRFSSKEFHQNSGLIYYLYRFYSPSLQRWVNRDPIEEEGGTNLFACVVNHVINLIDAWGLQCNLSPGGPLFPKPPSKDPLRDFIRQTANGILQDLLDHNKNTFRDWANNAVNSLLGADLGNAENLGLGGGSNQGGSGWGLNGLGVKYNFTPNFELKLSINPHIDLQHPHNSNAGCNAQFSWSF